MTELLDRLQAALGTTYLLQRELGGGGMSRVFVAEERALGRKVVVKVLPPELGAGLNIDRFRREVQLAASLHHPNIVPLLAAGEADGLLYYTMPLIEGESLRVKLTRESELPIGEAVRLLRDVVDALSCAHEHGVVHRDIKPDNVLVSRHHALVTDFGVAKALSEATGKSALTSTGVALGTPAYMAPEQAAADPHVDHRADIYAVGALAYEMLTGRPPFTGHSPQAVLAAQVTKAPEAVTESRASVPPALAALVMRCLEKKPADRWQSADELLHQLEVMATPSGGTTPTTAVSAVSVATTASAPAGGWGSVRNWQRSGYLALGAVIALGLMIALPPLLHRRAPTSPPNASNTPAKMLVVLPFENLGQPEDAYFADGMTEELTARLAGLKGLGVISRTSALQYRNTSKTARQIGQELGVGYLLEGTIRYEKLPNGVSRVRVTPQLIQAEDDRHLWANVYEEDLTQVFQVQSDIAKQVVKALDVALGDPERQALEERPTENLEAYQYYLRGKEFWARGLAEGDVRSAVAMYRKSAELDPRFALAWSNLSYAHSALYWFFYDRTPARLDLARRAAEEALRLQPELPEAHLALGYYYYWGSRDYARALEQLSGALASQPNNADILEATAYVQRRQGRWEEALANLEKSAALGPRDANKARSVIETQFFLGRYPEAESRLRQARSLFPDLPYFYIAEAQHHLSRDGNLARAREPLDSALVRITPSALMTFPLFWQLYRVLHDEPLDRAAGQVALGDFRSDTVGYFAVKEIWHQAQGRTDLARAYVDSASAVLETKTRARPLDAELHAQLGWIYAKQGRKEEAVREGRMAVELLPVSRDALAGTQVANTLAAILASVGQTDSAVDLLRSLVRLPVGPTIPRLKVEPDWEPLRSNPRFQQLLAGGK
ncbi:MAG: protein kinase domain-containing protein [Gemmatimonadales bacterium]